MAVKGSATVTLSQYRDTESVTRYYKLQSSSMAAPDKPSNVKPNETPAGWSKSEPACDITKTLYTCDVTVFSDKTTHVSDVSKSTSYEAAKEAWNKANNAQGTADKAQSSADKAQNTATEAAKTADNYISADSTGIMVSENKGAAKETPSNATKNNVLITEKDVQIRNGQKVNAKFTNDRIVFSGDKADHLIVKAYATDGVFTEEWSTGADDITGDNDARNNLIVKNIITEVINYGDSIKQFRTTFTYDGIPSVWLLFKKVGGFFAYAVGTDKNVGVYYEMGAALDREIDLHIDFPSGDDAEAFAQANGFSWHKLVGVKIRYNTLCAPGAVKIGEGVTDDKSDFKAFKIGKGTGRDQDPINKTNALDVDFDGNTYVGGQLDVEEYMRVHAGLMSYGNIECRQKVYANKLFVSRSDGVYTPLLDLIYPVGSIYMSVNETDPGTLIGGTWERIKDRFLLSAGDTYAAGNTGGSAKATLPSHTHTLGSGGYQLWGAKKGAGSTEEGNKISGDGKYYAAVKGNSTENYKWIADVDEAGVSDVSQANMPPYLAVYVWKRIS